MRKIILILFLCSFSINSQIKITETQKYTQIGLVWGILKYHHPDISKGKYNWNLELLNFLEDTALINEQEKLNIALINFIKKFNKNATLFKTRDLKIDTEKVFRKNLYYSWIEEKAFNLELKTLLKELKKNNNIGNFYASFNKLSKMISFENEKGIKDFNPLLKNHRLFQLYNFWNIIQYWDVNKYLTDKNWIDVLENLVDDFLKADTVLKYEYANLKMFGALNDSHSYQTSSFVYKEYLNHFPAFGVDIVNDTLLINRVYNKTLVAKEQLKLGDLIVKIDGFAITDYIHNKFAPIVSSSNKTYLRERLKNLILRSNLDTMQIQVVNKKGELVNKKIQLYKNFNTEGFKSLEKKNSLNWKKITPKITYINLAKITSKEFAEVFKKNKNNNGIILDLRNYPKNLKLKDFSKFLYPSKTTFINVLMPVKENPSFGEYNAEAPLKLIKNPFKVGKKNANYFKGKIILLVNRKTGSKAEFFGMAIQQSPNCITVGEQTMGAVMNITSAVLPDKQEFYFTGIGAFYPDGRGVQRKGLHIDYKINQTTKKYTTDLFINKALEIIQEK